MDGSQRASRSVMSGEGRFPLGEPRNRRYDDVKDDPVPIPGRPNWFAMPDGSIKYIEPPKKTISTTARKATP